METMSRRCLWGKIRQTGCERVDIIPSSTFVKKRRVLILFLSLERTFHSSVHLLDSVLYRMNTTQHNTAHLPLLSCSASLKHLQLDL
jgi:hypothetical protein